MPFPPASFIITERIRAYWYLDVSFLSVPDLCLVLLKQVNAVASPRPSHSTNVLEQSVSTELSTPTTMGRSGSIDETSLYEMVLDADPSLQPLSVGATTFKSAITSFIDLLIEQGIPTMVWARLPRGESWQLELERYCKQSEAAQLACLFHSPQDEQQSSLDEQENLVSLQVNCPAPGKLELLNEEDVDWLAGNNLTPRLMIPLERGNLMRGEYFMMAVSPKFQGLILARRVKNISPAPSMKDSPDFLASPPEPTPSESKSQLRMVYSSRPSVVHQVLGGVQQALMRVPSNRLRISLGLNSTYNEASHGSINIESLLRHWDQLFVLSEHDSPEMQLLNQLMMKQLHRQEELWRRVSTYRKQAESAESLQLQHEELMNAIRLKDEFLSMVVQELRTPLTNMKTALSLLNSPSLKTPQRQRYIQLLNTECDRQNSLISGLLNLAQIEQVGETSMQPITLIDVVPGVVSTYQPLAQEKEIMLAYTIPDTLPQVSTLVPWLRQVIVNLLHNSIKFTGKGGRVWVRAKLQGEYVQIDVQDTGIGISSGEIPKIFNRFYRIRPSSGEDFGGAGLGLTIVQQLLLRCGGSITVNSRLGQGSTFSVLLPIHEEDADSEEIE